MYVNTSALHPDKFVLNETAVVLFDSLTYMTRLHFSHLIPYTASHVLHALWSFTVMSVCSVPFMMLSFRIRGQIWHFGEQSALVFSSLDLNTLLCFQHKNVSQVSFFSKSYKWRRFENRFHSVGFME